MARYAEWYAVELDGYLKGRMSDVAKFEAVKELNSHFAEHVEDLVEKGMNSMDAEKAALASFGSPRDAALNLLNQGSRSRFGKHFFSLATVCIVLFVIFGCLFMQMLMLSLNPFSLDNTRIRSFPIAAGLLIAIALCTLAGAFLVRRLPLLRFGCAWLVGMAISAGYLLVGPEKHFASIPPSEFGARMTVWSKLNEETKELARIEESIRRPLEQRYSSEIGSVVPIDRAKAGETILALAPGLLKVNPSFVEVVGKETSGYLAPGRDSENQDFYLRSRHSRSPGTYGQITNESDHFPVPNLTLKYYKTADEAISAWEPGERAYQYSLGDTDHRWIAVRQHDLLNKAMGYADASRYDTAVGILELTAGITLGYLAFVVGIGWIVTMIPNLTLRSSYKRLIA